MAAIAMVAAMFVAAPAFAQDHTVHIGGEYELNKGERAATVTELSAPIGPVVGSVTVRSQFANDGARANNEFSVGAKYAIPFTYKGVTPFVKAEAGVKSSRGSDTFVGLEGGAGGAINEAFGWEAGYRWRNFNDQASEGRYRVTITQPIGGFVVDYSIFDWSVKGVNTVGAGIGASTKF